MAFYDSYETADGKYMAVGCLEPQFYAEFLNGLGIDATDLPHQWDPRSQDRLRRIFADKFKTKTRDEWWAIFEHADACTTPVLTFTEAEQNSHIRARSGRHLVVVGGDERRDRYPRSSARLSRLRLRRGGARAQHRCRRVTPALPISSGQVQDSGADRRGRFAAADAIGKIRKIAVRESAGADSPSVP